MFSQIIVNLSNDPGVNNDLAAVVMSTIDEFKKIYSEPPPAGIRPIHIGSDQKNGPLTDSTTNTSLYYVLLSVNGRKYNQVAYQLAHEICHIFADPRRSNWFTESCCELASLIILDKLTMAWGITPPFPNWISYAPNFKQYAEERIRKITKEVFQEEFLPDNKKLRAWLMTSRNTFKANPIERSRNTIIALMLRPIFEEAINNWKAIRFLGQASINPPISLKDLDLNVEINFDIWEKVVPEQLKEVVRRISALFYK